MKPSFFAKVALIFWVATITLRGSAQDVLVNVYDNSSSYLNTAYSVSNNQAIGQQIWLGNMGLYTYLTNFSFEVYSPSLAWSAGNNVQAKVRFYNNDGSLVNGYASPYTLFYDTGWFELANPNSIAGTHAFWVTIDYASLYTAGYPDYALFSGGYGLSGNYKVSLPSNFTVVYEFQGMAGSDSLYLPNYNPAAVGTNYGDIWVPDSSNTNNWLLAQNNSPIAFGQILEATVPEPSTLSLGALGIILLGRVFRKRK